VTDHALIAMVLLGYPLIVGGLVYFTKSQWVDEG
jgi:hypothetical protein